jgi:hypothetical protein
MRAAYDAVSPFIETHTSRICPTCEAVCCMDRHGEYEAEDLAYLEALGEPLPDTTRKEHDTEPCRHMTPTGCGIARWRRPFRCTWFFCARLLQEMPEADKRGYRTFIKALDELQALRTEIAAGLKR